MATGKKRSVAASPVPCSCGGSLRRQRMSGRYDVTAELGLPAELVGLWEVLRCDSCEKSALAGGVLEAVSDEAVRMLLELPRCLSGAEARFLRKAALAIGQEELAQRLGITRVTVARWEGSRSLSAEHDFELRALVGAQLIRRGQGELKKSQAKLIELVTGALASARKNRAPARPPALRISKAA